jgi:predicted membrane protein
MIIYIIAAFILIGAALATGQIVYSKRMIIDMQKRHEADMRVMLHLENSVKSYKEARDHWKDKYFKIVNETSHFERLKKI